MNATQSILAGSLLSTRKGLVINHVGIALGNGLIFHNSPKYGEHVSSLASFSKGKKVYITHQLSSHELSQTWARIGRMLQSPRGYHPTLNNCEHSLFRALGHAAKSPQLAAWTTTAIALAIGYVALTQ